MNVYVNEVGPTIGNPLTIDVCTHTCKCTQIPPPPHTGEGRPSRVGRPMWHSFADRPKRVAGVEVLSQSLPNLIGNDSLSGTCLSERYKDGLMYSLPFSL